MTYLELVQRLHQECGAGGAGPTTTVGLAGEYKRLATWVSSAYLDILRLHPWWKFMKLDFSFQTVAADGNYSKADVVGAGPRLARYRPCTLRYYLTATGQAGEQWMTEVNYDAFRDTYRFGSAATQQGAPTHYTIDSDKSLLLYAIPNAAYTITGQYYRAPQGFTLNTDAPLFDEEYHELIVWWALTKYAGFEESGSVYRNAMNQMSSILPALEFNELEQPSFGPALA